MAPGGWIELADFVFPALSDDGTLREDAALARWCQYGLECGRRMGSPLDSAKLYAAQLRAAGFQNVVETRHKWPQTTWAQGEKYKELGTSVVLLNKRQLPSLLTTTPQGYLHMLTFMTGCTE